jgi:drug/metabolite transporter (DMT)-like permease
VRVAAAFVLAYVLTLAGGGVTAASRGASPAVVAIGAVEWALLGLVLVFFMRRGHRWPAWVVLAIVLSGAVFTTLGGEWAVLPVDALAVGLWAWGHQAGASTARGVKADA